MNIRSELEAELSRTAKERDLLKTKNAEMDELQKLLSKYKQAQENSIDKVSQIAC